METPPAATCPVCEEVCFIEPPANEREREQFGDLSTECVGCGAQYKNLVRKGDKWVDDQGRVLAKAKDVKV